MSGYQMDYRGKLLLLNRCPKWTKAPEKWAAIAVLFSGSRRYMSYETVVNTVGDAVYVRRLCRQGILGVFRQQTSTQLADIERLRSLNT